MGRVLFAFCSNLVSIFSPLWLGFQGLGAHELFQNLVVPKLQIDIFSPVEDIYVMPAPLPPLNCAFCWGQEPCFFDSSLYPQQLTIVPCIRNRHPIIFFRWMGRWVDSWLNGWIDGKLDGWLDEWLDGWIDGWMDRYLNGWLDGWEGL